VQICRNYALFKVGYQFKCKGTFVNADKSLAGKTLTIRAKPAGKGNTTSFGGLGDVSVTFDAQGVGTGVFTIKDAAPTSTGTYDTHWTWFAQEGTKKEQLIGYSWHRILYCRKKPIRTVSVRQNISRDKPFTWIAWWSCDWAKGFDATDTAQARKNVVDAIFPKLDKTASTGPQFRLQYVYPSPGRHTSWDLLLRGRGSCGEWKNLFLEAAAAQGIKVSWRHIRVTPGAGFTMTAFRTKNTEKDVDGHLGPNNSRWAFADHSFCEFTGTVYDPTFANKRDATTWDTYTLELCDEFTDSPNREAETDNAKWKKVGSLGANKLRIVGRLVTSNTSPAPSATHTITKD
jgi:hypothetical protein